MENQQEVQEKPLSPQARKSLPDDAFVFPKTRKYPIHDLAHARNALSRVSAYGTPTEKKTVRAAVYRKYPELRKDAEESLSIMLSEAMDV